MFFQFLLYTLVSFRLSEMFVIDDGPFDIFTNLRGWFNRAAFDNSLRRNIANALMCVHCTGIWISFALGFIFYLANNVFVYTQSAGVTLFDAVLFSFAIAGGQSVLSGAFGRSR
jgi:hypothetical protein